MPAQHNSQWNDELVAFLGGSRRAGDAIYKRMRPPVFAIVRSRAPDLMQDREDVLNEVFVLMMENPGRFDAQRGSARAFITTAVLPDAIQRVRAKAARAGTTTRRRKRVKVAQESTFPMPDPIPGLEAIEVSGYGSPSAMEAASDARKIWSSSPPALRVIIGGLIDGHTQADIASELNVDRFKLGRMVKTLRQFVAAA